MCGRLPGMGATSALAALTATLLALPPYSAASQTPLLRGPQRVMVGHLVPLVARGYRPGSRVTLAAQAAKFRGSNTGVVRLGRDSYRVPASGTLHVRVRWPKGYDVGCTAVGCPGPPTPQANGTRVNENAVEVEQHGVVIGHRGRS
jgi:hypothetical protein